MLLIHRQTDALIEVTTNGDTLESITPPVCGSCLNFAGNRCRSSHRVNPKQTVQPDETSCDQHRWNAGFVRLNTLVDSLRRDPGNPAHVRQLSSEFMAAEERDQRYFESIRDGQRPAVELATVSTEPIAPRRVNCGPAGERNGVDWPNSTNARSNMAWKPAVEY